MSFSLFFKMFINAIVVLLGKQMSFYIDSFLKVKGDISSEKRDFYIPQPEEKFIIKVLILTANVLHRGRLFTVISHVTYTNYYPAFIEDLLFPQ